MSLDTHLKWNARVLSNVSPRRGALVGTLLGVVVTGRDNGRGTAYQLEMCGGEIRTVWWTGTVTYGSVPVFRDVDTDAEVLRDPKLMVSFARLDSHELKGNK
jgi:hypothetical protein